MVGRVKRGNSSLLGLMGRRRGQGRRYILRMN